MGWLGLLVPLAQLAGAQPPADSSIVIAPGARYQKSGLHRFFLGDTHRDLWATPVRFRVLDLDRYAGGLVATERGGSRQSKSLRLQAADGRMFTFRALDKDPTQTWPVPLRSSPARKFAEDQISALLPAGALAVAVLEEAAGILHSGLELMVLPDHSRLGAWRDEFAGQPGILEQRLRGENAAVEAATGALEVVTSQDLFRRLKADGRQVVDQERFLAARLFDLVVGDWDRHADQWGWARFDEPVGSRWVPLPRDRDWAMSVLDGPLYGLLRWYLPKYQSFGDRYGSIYGLTLAAEGIDRRLLVGLDADRWDRVTADLTSRLTDQVIDRAVAALPREFPAAGRADLAAALKARRDALPAAARRLYRQLAGQVELRGSDGADSVAVEIEPSSVVVSVADSRGTTRWRRRFLAQETDEIRLYLYQGRDRLVVTPAAARSPIRLRVIGDDSSLVEAAKAASIASYSSDGSFRSPVDPQDPVRIHRDWGTLRAVAPWFEARPEIGTLIGGGPVLYQYGFRKVPYASRIALRAAFATGAPGLNLDADADFRFIRPDRRLRIRASMLRTDAVRYFGLGNETTRSDDDDFHTTRQRLISVAPSLELDLGPTARLELSPSLRSSRTDPDPTSLLARERPYGSGDFTEIAFEARGVVDTRNHPRYPTSGVHLEAAGRVAPAALDLDEAYYRFDARAAAFITATMPATPTLALRAGGSRVWGRVPFFGAPSIGGRGSVRGLNSQRFLGDAAAFASAELRLDLGQFTVLVPGDWGLFGLSDVGRVFVDGQASRQWHSAVGGGLWFAFLDRKSTMTLSYASASERARFYLQAGFHF
ncbi:MAG: hypothetical protein FJ206_10525 [Gemmatimonadetes bacterium]|nr:hypothetical protein [Gemmatimonadota bacterium]